MRLREYNESQKQTKYMNPYVAGLLLGLTLLASVFIAGRGLGASGAVKGAVVAAVEGVAPSYAESGQFFKDYSKAHKGSPLKQWLVFEMLGVIIGGFVSGLMANRLKFQVEKGEGITNKTRLWFALLGGILFGYGASLGRGCTSGAALSGMGVLATDGFVAMLAIFGGAYLFAYFFRKLWI